MEVLIGLIIILTAAGSAGIARWTRFHPLLIASIAGLPGAALGFLVAAVACSNPIPLAAIGFVLIGGIGAFGAFLGWLRRDFLMGNK
jgi:hypothetical protein